MTTFRLEANMTISFYMDFDTMAEAQEWAVRCERSDDAYIPDRFSIESLHMNDTEIAPDYLQTQEGDNDDE